MSKEDIEACATPIESLVAKPREEKKKKKETTKIMTTVLKIVLDEAARDHPYAALEKILKACTGQSPLSKLRFGNDMLEVYWDVSEESDREAIRAGLKAHGYLRRSPPLTAKDVPRRVRAYLWSYFPLLRRAALEGLGVAEKSSVLGKVERHWSGSLVEEKKRMWRNRTARDWDDLKIARDEESYKAIMKMPMFDGDYEVEEEEADDEDEDESSVV